VLSIHFFPYKMVKASLAAASNPLHILQVSLSKSIHYCPAWPTGKESVHFSLSQQPL
jgi:hypothetical protein